MQQWKERYLVLQQLKRYEEAEKRALKLAKASLSLGKCKDGVMSLQCPLLDVVKHYRAKIAKIREELRSM